MWWTYDQNVKSYYGHKITKFKWKLPNIQPDYLFYSILTLKKFTAKIISICLRKKDFNFLSSISEGTYTEKYLNLINSNFWELLYEQKNYINSKFAIIIIDVNSNILIDATLIIIIV